MNAVMNLRFPQNSGNFLTNLESDSFSRRTLLRKHWRDAKAG